MCNDTESKITFEVGEEVRVLRGYIVDEDEHFITVKRNDGIHKISKKYIIKIEKLDYKWIEKAHGGENAY